MKSVLIVDLNLLRVAMNCLFPQEQFRLMLRSSKHAIHSHNQCHSVRLRLSQLMSKRKAIALKVRIGCHQTKTILMVGVCVANHILQPIRLTKQTIAFHQRFARYLQKDMKEAKRLRLHIQCAGNKRIKQKRKVMMTADAIANLCHVKSRCLKVTVL